MRAEVEVDRDVVVQAVLNLLANAAKYGGADKADRGRGRRRRAGGVDRGARSRPRHPARTSRRGSSASSIARPRRTARASRAPASGSRWSSATSRRSAARSRSRRRSARARRSRSGCRACAPRRRSHDAHPRRRGRSVDPHGPRGHARGEGLRGRRRRRAAATAPSARRPAATTSSCSTSCCPTSTASRCAGASARARARRARVPVIMLSARGAELDRVRGLELGADDYVTKPFSLMELLARVASVLRRAQRRRAPSRSGSRSATSTIDLVGQVATRGGKRIELPSRAFAILKVFARRPGEVVSRDVLLDEAWGYEDYPNTRTVDNHLVKLRQALEDEPERAALARHRPRRRLQARRAAKAAVPVDAGSRAMRRRLVTTFCDGVTAALRCRRVAAPSSLVPRRGRGDGAGIGAPTIRWARSGAGAAPEFSLGARSPAAATTRRRRERRAAPRPPRRARAADPGGRRDHRARRRRAGARRRRCSPSSPATTPPRAPRSSACSPAADAPRRRRARRAPPRAARGARRQDPPRARSRRACAPRSRRATRRSPRASRSSRPTSSRRAAPATCAARALGTPLPGVDPKVADAFAAAERALAQSTRCGRGRTRGAVVVDRAQGRRDRGRRREVSRGRRRTAASRRSRRDYRIGSLYHDLALGLLFEPPPELDPAARPRAPHAARAGARVSRSARPRRIARASPGRSSTDAELWRLAAETDLRARACDVLGREPQRTGTVDRDDRRLDRRRARRRPSARRSRCFDRGLLYGDGVFEVLRTWHGVAVDLDAHLDRLYASARRARSCASPPRSTHAVRSRAIAAAGAGEHRVRIVVTRGPGALARAARRARAAGARS